MCPECRKDYPDDFPFAQPDPEDVLRSSGRKGIVPGFIVERNRVHRRGA